MSKLTRTEVSAAAPIDYYFKSPKGDSPLILLLHGFAQDWSDIYQPLAKIIPKNFGVLAVNGTYPLPKRNKETNEWDISFAWYFFDREKRKYLIDQKFSRDILTSLIKEKLNISNKVIIIGYSQGGYLAPFVASKLSSTKSVFMINANLKVEMLPKKIHCPVYCLNGIKDPIVCPKNARQSFNQFISNGNSGEFFEIEKTHHNISPQILDKLIEFLK